MPRHGPCKQTKGKKRFIKYITTIINFNGPSLLSSAITCTIIVIIYTSKGKLVILIFRETACLAADTPLSVRAHLWKSSLPGLSFRFSGIASTFTRACSSSSSIVGTPGFLKTMRKHHYNHKH